jgi:8-oxo-dGTP pyrophosphatase MutT (NUDIX family)
MEGEQMYNFSTAGAFVLYDGLFAFMVGHGAAHRDNELGIVRFGGHREGNETAEKCAIREVKEEATLDIEIFNSSVTYSENSERIDCDIAPRPVLIRGESDRLSIMFLARARGTIKPNMETQGILLLREKNVRLICSGQITLREYLASGGAAVGVEKFSQDCVLVPHFQLLFLNKLLDCERKLMTDFLKSE